ncbi:hypothetical protein Trydic_g9769 [Trypoxylus dichotomus]
MVTTKLVPPDGGYGWMIVGALALHHFLAYPIMQGFGLIFKDPFRDLGFTATDTSFIMNTSGAFSMFVGILVAPLLKYIGYRKVSLIGATFITIGLLLTAQANSFTQYMIFYSVITAIGNGMGMCSYPLALNSYFLKRRAKAAGYALTICGLGLIIMPQVYSLLLYSYGVKGTVIIVAALASHTYVSSLLLQPIKWHMKEEPVANDINKVENEKLSNQEADDKIPYSKEQQERSVLSLEQEIQIQLPYNACGPLTRSLLSLDHGLRESNVATSLRRQVTLPIFPKEVELKEMEPFVRDKPKITEKKTLEENQLASSNELNGNKINRKKSSVLKRIGKAIVDMFDLTLLKSPTFVNMMIGMSFAVFAEMNFTILTPFIMQDFGLDTSQIATFMSTISVADICFRFVAPYVSDYFQKPARIMYMCALVLLILSRSSLLLTDNYYALLGCAGFLGLAKGFRMVYWALVMPTNVPIERLASASGLQSTVNSFFVWLGGPFLGFVRDATGSYKKSILVINSLTFVTILMWGTEFIYLHYRNKKKATQDEAVS